MSPCPRSYYDSLVSAFESPTTAGSREFLSRMPSHGHGSGQGQASAVLANQRQIEQDLYRTFENERCVRQREMRGERGAD